MKVTPLQVQKYIPFVPSARGKWERRGKKRLLNDPFIQFSIASLIYSPGNRRVSKAHLSPWSRPTPPVIVQLVMVRAYQNPKHSEKCQCGDSWSLSWWKKSNTVCAAAATTEQPSPIKQNSSRVHPPLTTLISLPLAKGSPQFPLPLKGAAFIFSKVVN